MRTSIVLFTCILSVGCFAQGDTATEARRNDLKRFLEINTIPGVTSFDNPEGVRLESMSAAQALGIIPSFLATNDPVAIKVCWSMIGRAILHRPNTPEQRKALVELLCRYYLQTDWGLQTADNILFEVRPEDFNEPAKKYIAALFDPQPKFGRGISAKLAATAQLRELIPKIWAIAGRKVETMQNDDAEVLSALARLDEPEANKLLCQYYQYERSKPDVEVMGTQYTVTRSNHLSFSLNKSSLDCLLADFNKIDIDLKQRGNDYSWWPAQYLGSRIVQMLKHYPYNADYGSLDPVQLKNWLRTNPPLDLKEK